MSNNCKKYKEPFKSALYHLECCAACRCKVAAEHQTFSEQIQQISTALRNTREIADRILQEQCGKAPKTPCQKSEKEGSCYKKSRVYITWNKK